MGARIFHQERPEQSGPHAGPARVGLELQVCATAPAYSGAPAKVGSGLQHQSQPKLPHGNSHREPSWRRCHHRSPSPARHVGAVEDAARIAPSASHGFAARLSRPGDRKSTRLNSSHLVISYAVFCLKKKKKKNLKFLSKNKLKFIYNIT